MSEPTQLEEIFLAALEKSSPQERAAYLDAACRRDDDLRRRVERLLAAHPQAQQFLDAPAALAAANEATAAYAASADRAGVIIAGRYKLLEQIGEGGMGEVWVADQMVPIRRRVALKLIKPGMDSRAVLSRFEAERQALALMDHPHIARVLDAGTTDEGRPYFVMELVKGTPITTFCDAARLTPNERLELFVPVCQAIQHAHQKGIIHRDIKPSNVLVALHDEKPVVKVIDFGVAKAVGQQLTEKTLYTGFGSLVGTPAYMAPEQATFNQLDVDTRADVYALGVLLYELLAGSPPFEPERLKQAALDEVLRLVREEEPPRPSVRLSTSQSRASIAAVRQSQPEQLTQLMRGDLDWIVMKALEKDRNRRYETATGFAADVQRFLAGEAVLAHPPSATYRARKFARKHRAVLATVAAFGMLLLVSAIVSAKLAVKAIVAERAAEDRRADAEENARRAQKNAAEAAGYLMAVKTYAAETAVQRNSLQIDLDLVELANDNSLGLLRLCKTLGSCQEREFDTGIEVQPGVFRSETDLQRDFLTAAVLANGQNYAPLLPPITHDGQPVVFVALSPDNQALLTLGKDYAARLWDTRTARPIAVLRQADEQVVECGFSPDGRTVFTDDLTSVARLWDASGGRFRAATERRPNRYAGSEEVIFNTRRPLGTIQISDGRLLTQRWTLDDPVVELWDSASGKLTARLDTPNLSARQFQFLGGGRWLAAIDGSSTVLIFSPEDGQVVGRLDHPAGETVNGVDATSTGQRIATVSAGPQGGPGTLVRTWDAGSWKMDSAPMPINADGSAIGRGSNFQCWTEDLFAFSGMVDVDGVMWDVYRYGQPEPLAVGIAAFRLLPPAGDLVRFHNGLVYHSRTWQRVLPPPGRKFPPDLAQFAQDGRFVTTYPGGLVIDTVTDKVFGEQANVGWINLPGWPATTSYGNVAGFGLVAARYEHLNSGEPDSVKIRLIPPPSRLDLPADLLEAWAQVVVCGEVGGDGQFIHWDEATWEKRRQELANKPAPYPEFPFPGFVVNDKLHWLRAEFREAKTEADRLRTARELVYRAESAGNRAEAVRWQTEVDRRMPKAEPPPRAQEP